jgi:hypothetical protein
MTADRRPERTSSDEPPIEALLYTMLRSRPAGPAQRDDVPDQADKVDLPSRRAVPRQLAWIAGVAIAFALAALLLWVRRSDVVTPAPPPAAQVSRETARPDVQPPLAASPSPEVPARPPETPARPSPPAPRPLPPIAERVAPVPTTGVTARAPAPVAPDASSVANAQERREAINRVLYQYEKEVPGQNVAFDQCAITVVELRATARCTGTVRDSQLEPSVRRAKWVIQLVESEGNWRVEHVTTAGAR